MLILLTGIWLAANGICATKSTPPKSVRKPTSHAVVNAAHSRSAHPTARKAGASASHTARKGKTAQTSARRYPAKRTTLRAGSASTRARTSNRTSASRGRRAPHRTRLTPGQQRLARLHLEPDRVQEIQQALIREGYLPTDAATGEWDLRTHDAMLRYQTMHGFPATGLPEAKSLMKLGLGSHPLPPELDHSSVGIATPTAAPGLAVPPTSPPVSQSVPPS